MPRSVVLPKRPIKVEDPLLHYDAAAAVFGVRTSKFYSLVREGLVPPAIKIGSTSRWPESELRAVLALYAVGASEDQLRDHTKKLIKARAARARDAVKEAA